MTTTPPLLMIPGPIEIESSVIEANARAPMSHLDPEFVGAFGRVLTGLREVFGAPDAQPFVVSGSGTLAMEMAIANIVERGDAAVVVDTGYFSERMARILERHGATVVRVRGALGDVPSLEEISRAIETTKAKLITVTHVDTSTGVLAPVREIASLARERGAMVVVDGVCSVGGEKLEMKAWDVDVVLTASQKALGAPPGLAIVLASLRAMEVHAQRKSPVASFYADFSEWLPIMRAYETRNFSYFATPPVNLIFALDASITSIKKETMPARWSRHDRIARSMNAAWSALALQTLPVRKEQRAHTLSALYYPTGVDASLVGRVRDHGVVVAGGLHPDARTKYFRVGHMGKVGEEEITRTVSAVARALGKNEHEIVQAATSAWKKT